MVLVIGLVKANGSIQRLFQRTMGVVLRLLSRESGAVRGVYPNVYTVMINVVAREVIPTQYPSPEKLYLPLVRKIHAARIYKSPVVYCGITIL